MALAVRSLSQAHLALQGRSPDPGRVLQPKLGVASPVSRCAVVCRHAVAADGQPAHSHQHPDSGHSHTHAGHSHGHGHHHHHGHSHYPNTPVSKLLGKLGILSLAEAMEHSTAITVAGIASYLVALLVSAPFISSLMPAIAAQTLHTAALACTFVFLGVPQVVESVCIAASGVLDTHVLMSLAAFGTLYLGMAQEGALLLLLFQLSHLLEEKFTARAEGSLQQLFANLPNEAMVVEVEDGSFAPQLESVKPVGVQSVGLGTMLLVRPGEQVPLDGKVVWGSAHVSQQHITGESLPVRVEPGTDIPAGSLNNDGLLVVKVTASQEDSTPARIARMASEAQSNKPRIARLLDSIQGIWTKAVVAATVATVAVLLALGVPLLAPGGALYRAMGVLTAGSPCAVVLVPLAYVCAIATITRHGVLLRSAAVLDNLLTCSTVALDKTGTITKGTLSLSQLHVTTLDSQQASDHAPALYSVPLISDHQHQKNNGNGKDNSSSSSNGSSTARQPQTLGAQQEFGQQAMAFAVALSRASTHPVSRAMVQHGNMHPQGGMLSASVSDFQQVPGLGVQGLCQLQVPNTANGGPTSSMDSTPVGDRVMVHFGSVDYVRGQLSTGSQRDQLERVMSQHTNSSGARAVSALLISPVGSTSSSNISTRSGSITSGAEADSDTSSSDTQDAPGSAGDSQVHIALFGFEDQVASGARTAVQALKQGRWRKPGSRTQHASDKKELVMLTGDQAGVAASVARLVGIDSWQAGLRPEDKLSYVKDFDARIAGTGSTAGLVMVGDGINDAPALAASRVGVAVANSPADLVAAAADVIMLNGQGVANLPWLFAMAYRTRMIVQQNLALALIAVVIATLPTVAGMLPLWLAVLLHEGSTLLVALNSLRLLLDPDVDTLPAALAQAGTAMRDMFSSHNQDHSHHHHDHHHDHDHDHDHEHDHDHQHEREHVNGGHGKGRDGTAVASKGPGDDSSQAAGRSAGWQVTQPVQQVLQG